MTQKEIIAAQKTEINSYKTKISQLETLYENQAITLQKRQEELKEAVHFISNAKNEIEFLRKRLNFANARLQMFDDIKTLLYSYPQGQGLSSELQYDDFATSVEKFLESVKDKRNG